MGAPAIRDLDDALGRADAAAARLRELSEPSAGEGGSPRARELHVVTCLYDTAHHDLEALTRGRLSEAEEVAAALPGWSVSFTIVDDAPAADGRCVANVVAELLAARTAPVVRLGSLTLPERGPADQKGRALRHGLADRLERGGASDLFAYVNFNRKVHLRQLISVLEPILRSGHAASFATRAPEEGGAVHGAGAAGRLKSRVYNALVRLRLPPLRGWRDTNAPMKVFTAPALRHLLAVARVDDVSFDSEWLLALCAGGFSVGRAPVIWRQESGSRPPWGAVPRVLRSLGAQRRRWLRGAYEASAASREAG